MQIHTAAAQGATHLMNNLGTPHAMEPAAQAPGALQFSLNHRAETRSAEVHGVDAIQSIDTGGARIADAASVADPFQRMQAIQHETRSLISRLKGGDAETLLRLFDLQSGMQEATMSIEIMSKALEQTVSGTRNVLQTQA